MTTPEPSLAEQIHAAEQAGNWRESRRLKAAQLADLSRRTDHQGRIHPEPEAPEAAVPAQPAPAPARPGTRPTLALRPVSMPTTDTPGPGIVGMLDAAQTAAQPPEGAPPAPARTPVEQLAAPGTLHAPEDTRAQQIAAAEQAGDWATSGRLKAAWLAERAEQMNGAGDW